MELEGKVSIITGASNGIGKRCAETFAREGAIVVVADYDCNAGQAVVSTLQASGYEARFIAVDVTIPKQVEAMVTDTITVYGRLDVLLSNAGIGGRKLGDGPVHICSVEGWDTIMEVNLRGTFLACKYCIPELLKVRGCIITMASVLGIVGTQGLFDTHAYSTSKAAIIGLTRTIATHYASQGLRANTVAPGLIDTKMATRTIANPTLLEQIEFWQPLAGIGEVNDVADAAVYLASEKAKFITGIVLPIDGGWSAQ